MTTSRTKEANEVTNSESGAALAELENRLTRELGFFRYPERTWVNPRSASDGRRILDVLVVGGGQSGLAIAFGLIRENVREILVIDENPENREGPWRTFARMPTLRTPKHVQGPDFGIPSLSLRAWFEARFGPTSWAEMTFVPTAAWADYLSWYRRVLRIPVENDTRAGAVRWLEGERCFAVPVTRATGNDVLLARKVVLATGIDGAGTWLVPDIVRERLPRDRYAHTRELIDFQNLRGRRVAVLGAGASAFDNAWAALEAGAAEVRLFFRRKELVRVNPYRWAEFVGFLKHHGDLPDAERWRFARRILVMGQLPPKDTYERVRRWPNFTLEPGCPFDDLTFSEPTIHIKTPVGPREADFLIVGAGFATDLRRRPELALLVDHVALWEDRYVPPPGEEHDELGRHPYLGSSFELQEKVPGEAPYLSSVFHFTFGCLPSLGFGGASISGMKYGVPRIVSGITRQLYLDDIDHHFASLISYDHAEL